MPEPLGVAFIEIEPVAAGFRAKTEAQVRTQLAGLGGIPITTASTAAATAQVDNLARSATRAATAEELLASTTAQLTANQERLALVTNNEARARLRSQLATEADAGAKRALLAITTSTNAATVREIELLNAKTAAELRAAGGTAAHGTAAGTAARAFAAESAALTGLRGSSLAVSPAFLAATVAAVAFFKSADLAAEFDQQLKLIQESTQATADEMEDVRRSALDLGRDLNLPLTSAQDAAEAINLLSRSGFDLQESLEAAPAVLLATAAGTQELGASVSLTDQLLDAFNLKAEDSLRVANQLAIGSRFTQGNIEEFAGALASVAPAADSSGLSLEDTATLMLQLAESGLSGSQGAAVLRTTLLRLNDVSPEAARQLRRIGLGIEDLRDDMGNLRPDAFVILAEALDDLDAAEQRRVITQIFSRRAALGVLRLVDQQREGFQRAAAATRDNEAAQRQAEARAAGFKGALEETKKEAEDFGRQLGEVTQGPATEFVTTIGDIFRGSTDAVGALSDLTKGVADLGDELTDAIPDVPFQDQILGVGGRVAKLALPGQVPREIARGISGIVGVFRDGERDVDQALTTMNTNVQDHLDRTAALVAAGAGKIDGAFRAIPQTLNTQLAVAQATGTEDDELRILRQQRDAALERLRRNERRLAAGDPRITQAAVQRAANEVTAAENAIDAILSGRRSAREAAADRREAAAAEEARKAQQQADALERAADARDAAFIRGMQRALDRKQETVSVAASTEGLRDDIRANVALRNFLGGQARRFQERIEDVRAAGRSAEALVAELRVLRRARRDVVREIQALQAEQRRQQAETQVEQAQLDLQILEVRVGDDPNARQENLLAAAHQRVINALLRAQRLTKKRSVEWKRLQLQIEQEKAAIRALRDAASADPQADRDQRTFQQQTFEFLQAMQGFSTNLASNLIPGFATTGLVAGGSTPTATTPSSATVPPSFRPMQSPFQRAQATEATAVRGVTSGQGNAVIAELRQIRAELRRLNQGSDHPEAKEQRRRGSAAGDYAGGGTVGM